MHRFSRGFTALLITVCIGLVAAASVAQAGDADKNKEMFKKFVNDVMNGGNLEMIDHYLAADFVEHETMPPGIAEGREGCKQFFSMFRNAFPDLKVTVDDILADGDKVVARQTWTATNKGEFMGMPATGKEVTFTVIDIIRFEDGKAVEHWGAYDSTTMMAQMHPEMMQGGKGMHEEKSKD